MALIQEPSQNVSKKRLSVIFLAITVLLFYVIHLVSTHYDISLKLITGDPLSTFNVNPLTGIVSNLGVLLWCTTAAILFFSYFLINGKIDNKVALFLLYSAFLTSVLLFDDLFMFHEHILKSIGIEESVMYVIYVILFGIFFVVYSSILKYINFKYLLPIAFASFGGSVIIDLLFTGETLRPLFEDGFKFLGIVSWSMFFVFNCFELVKSGLSKND